MVAGSSSSMVTHQGREAPFFSPSQKKETEREASRRQRDIYMATGMKYSLEAAVVLSVPRGLRFVLFFHLQSLRQASFFRGRQASPASCLPCPQPHPSPTVLDPDLLSPFFFHIEAAAGERGESNPASPPCLFVFLFFSQKAGET